MKKLLYPVLMYAAVVVTFLGMDAAATTHQRLIVAAVGLTLLGVAVTAAIATHETKGDTR